MQKDKVFFNPHLDWFGTNLRQVFLGGRSNRKLAYIFQSALQKQKTIHVLIEGKNSKYKSKIYEIIKFCVWCFINKYSIKKIKINSTKFNHKQNDYELFIPCYPQLANNRVNKNSKIKLKKLSYLTTIYLNHYFLNPQLLNKGEIYGSVNSLSAEAQLNKCSPYFNKLCELEYKNFRMLPFVADKRFKKYTEVIYRKKDVLFIGSLTEVVENQLFNDYFKTNQLHPIRKYIYDNKTVFEKLGTVRIAPAIIKQSRSLMKQLLHKFYKNKNMSYYNDFNIVDEFNEHFAFVCPEEIIGLPAISFVEGILSGCLYIGCNKDIYSSYNLKPNVDYVLYDGSPVDLIEKCQDIKNNREKYTQIAQNGFTALSEFYKNN
jgi:hypothetical protein